MNIERASKLHKYFHLTLAVSMICVMVNYYFKIVDLNFNIIFTIVLGLGILSIPITIWYKIKLTNSLNQTKASIYTYKRSKIIWSAVLIGFATISIAKEADSHVKIIALSIGVYLVVNQLVDFLAGQYFNTNILSFNAESIIDLNGRIKMIRYTEIKDCIKDTGSITIYEKYDKYKVKKKDFLNSEGMLDELNNMYANKKK